jgi:hypothetical protein
MPQPAKSGINETTDAEVSNYDLEKVVPVSLCEVV